MATKKAKKKTAQRKPRGPSLQERAVIALERIADYLQPTLTMAAYKHTEVHGGVGVSPAELTPTPLPTDAELMS